MRPDPYQRTPTIPRRATNAGAIELPYRILMTTDAVGGVWTFATELAKALAGSGCEVCLVTLGPPPNEAQRAVIASTDRISLIETDLQLEWQDPSGADTARAAIELGAIARRFNPDLVHLNGFREASLAWDVPTVLVAHSCVNTWADACDERDAFKGASWESYTSAVRHGLSDADVWIAPTEAFRQAIAQTYHTSTPGRVIWNGVGEIDTHFQAQWKKEFVLAAGRVWDKAKNLAALTKASANVPWPVRVAGPAALGADDIRDDDSCAVHFGELTHDALLEAMRDASVFVSPARYEPFGLAVLEAARAGCALVLSDISTFRELWGGAALFFDPRQPGALETALRQVCADAVARERLQQAASARASLYVLSETAAAYKRLYASLAHRSRSSTFMGAVA